MLERSDLEPVLDVDGKGVQHFILPKLRLGRGTRRSLVEG
jgi:hypothetical protein